MTAQTGERLPYLLARLKAPRVRDRLEQTAERAREEGWPYEQFLEALLEAEVFAREASGARQRIQHAAFPAHKTLEDFDFTAQPSAEKPLLLHLAQLAWIHEHANVCLIGPPGTGKTHLAITASRSPPPNNGSPASSKRRTATTSTTNCAASNATACSSSTKSDTCRWSAKPPTCCSRWSRAATNAARSWSPQTAASRPGARSSATRWSPPR